MDQGDQDLPQQAGVHHGHGTELPQRGWHTGPAGRRQRQGAPGLDRKGHPGNRRRQGDSGHSRRGVPPAPDPVPGNLHHRAGETGRHPDGDRQVNTLSLYSDAGIALVRLNRPATRNAIDDTLIAELTHTVATLNQDPELRVVILSGEG
ncbi:MAG: hypothetical protein KC488_15705, partial [Candidatus Cloacimonetes bacterium]|nr:hypothetical protein [Candidatus Cloacimonadota bacterium]